MFFVIYNSLKIDTLKGALKECQMLNWTHIETVDSNASSVESCDWFTTPRENIFCEIDISLYMLVRAMLLFSFKTQFYQHIP